MHSCKRKTHEYSEASIGKRMVARGSSALFRFKFAHNPTSSSGQTVGSESVKCLAAVFETTPDIVTREQHVNIPKDKSVQARLNKKEKEAVKFGQTLFKEPKRDEADPLTGARIGIVCEKEK
jgi:hypothetical protein